MLPVKRGPIAKDELQDQDVSSKRLRKTKGDEGVDMFSNVKFEDTTEFTLSSAVLKTRSALSPRDLPSECLHSYRVAFKPAIREFVGTLGPWEYPSDADVVRIWNARFPNHQLEASESLHIVVSKLVEVIVKDWRRNMAIAAVECLNVHLKSKSDKQSQRAAQAAWLLGDDEKDRKRPFYYKDYADGVQPSGIFQSPIIAATLASHISSISCLPKQSRVREYPIGALALSILAVKRALTWAKSGIECIPKTSEGHFSRANWGDHYSLKDGQYVPVKAASNIVAVIKKLRDIHWNRIIAEAERHAAEKNVLSVLILEDEASNQSDFNLEDWDDDFE